jgi:exopolyphosphatase/guanosine-5'-triphosphate,3'-diphosphate pyrophosphatase
MVVGELRHGQLAIIDRIKETVRLSEGLAQHDSLTPAAKQRALECLSRFGQRLQDMHASSVRTAGTSALRRARDSAEFLREAERALGQPIEVISGIEEARLIFRGATERLPPAEGLRLVFDIGGGSTELILGEGKTPRALESLRLGCVSITERFFDAGVIDRQSFDRARLAVRLELRPVKAFFRDSTELEAIGTSGTIIATELVARETDLIESNDLTPAVVEQLIERVLDFGNVSELSLPGLSERRAQVWPGGLAILIELLKVLRVEHLRVSDGALREGLLYDHIGRLHHEDARERTVDALARRFNTDHAQGARVAHTAAAGKCGSWIARLNQSSCIGVRGSTKSAWTYRMKGFSNTAPISPRMRICRAFPDRNRRFSHISRGQIDMQLLEKLPSAWRVAALRMSIIHRLAVLLNRSRSTSDLPRMQFDVSGNRIKLAFPDEWLAENPLTVADLNREQEYLRYVDFELEFS